MGRALPVVASVVLALVAAPAAVVADGWSTTPQVVAQQDPYDFTGVVGLTSDAAGDQIVATGDPLRTTAPSRFRRRRAARASGWHAALRRHDPRHPAGGA